MVRQMKERHAREEKVTAAYFTGFTFVSNAAKAAASVTSCHVIYPKLADASNRRKNANRHGWRRQGKPNADRLVDPEGFCSMWCRVLYIYL